MACALMQVYQFIIGSIVKGSLVRNFRSYEQLDSLVKW